MINELENNTFDIELIPSIVDQRDSGISNSTGITVVINY